ncbi:MAG: hypothetical protein V2J02_19350 [Pseudomonadales bacterium]|jgi:hypothetical protein|nr:hypothetical protein [Pseudomonadales bacterium]
MDQPNRIELRLRWRGEDYACRPDMQTLMMIEERVLLHRLASRIARGPDEIPSTHLLWVVYCLLYRAGARITADEVRQAAVDGDLETQTMVDVAGWLVSEVYGPGPRKREEDEEPAPGKPEA